MSESSILTLDIGGDSDEAVEAVNAVAEALANMSDATKDLNPELAAYAENSAATQESAEAAGQSGDDFAATLSTIGDTAGKISPALRPVGDALSGVGQSMKEVEQAGGVMTLGLSGIVGIAGTAVTALVGLGVAGANDANEIMRLSAVMQLSEQDAERWSIAMDMAGGSSASLNRAVLLVGNAAETNSGAFERIGVSVRNADGSMRSAGQTFEDTIAALANMSDGTARTAAASEIFGSRFAAQLIPLIEHYNKIMPEAAELSERVARAQGSAAEAAINYNMQMSRLKENVENIGGFVLPALNGVLGVVSGTLETSSMFVQGAGLAAGAAASGYSDLMGSMDGAGKAASESAVAQMMLEKIQRDVAASGGEASAMQKMLIDRYSETAQESEDAAASAEDFAASEDEASTATTKLSDALAQQVNALGLSKYGFTESSQGVQAYLDSLSALTGMLGDAAAAERELASAMGMRITISSSGQTTITPRATGGPVRAGQAYLVGEEGVPELFVSDSDGYIFPGASRGSSPAMAGGGGGGTLVVIYNQHGPVFGMSDLKRQVLDFVKEDVLNGGITRGYVNS